MKCNRCDNEAFLRVDEKTVLCADCYSIEARFIEALDTSAHPPDVATDAAEPQPGSSASVAHSFDDGIPEKLRRRA